MTSALKLKKFDPPPLLVRKEAIDSDQNCKRSHNLPELPSPPALLTESDM